MLRKLLVQRGVVMNKGVQQVEGPSEVTTIQQTVSGSNLKDVVASADDLRLIELLCAGNEVAFVLLINRYHNAMVRLAMVHVTAQAVAEEVVQETWMAILEGLKHFEGRSSLKTWMFRILTNRAKTCAQREGRCLPFSSLPDLTADLSEPVADSDRFQSRDQPYPSNWRSFSSNWDEMPEECLLSQETCVCIERAIKILPPNQREVIILRDIEGWTSKETCHLLDISEVNQRVLLHRARSKVRGVIERYFEEE